MHVAFGTQDELSWGHLKNPKQARRAAFGDVKRNLVLGSPGSYTINPLVPD